MSPGMSFGVTVPRLGPLRLDLFEADVGVIAPAEPMGGKRGVDEADLVPPRKLPLQFRFMEGIDGATGVCDMDMRPLLAACRFREGRPDALRSSLPGDAVRRFVPTAFEPEGCCACGWCWRLLEDPEPSEPGFVLYAPSQGLAIGESSSKSRSPAGTEYGLVMF